jgi:serine O-acetyltransferase
MKSKEMKEDLLNFILSSRRESWRKIPDRMKANAFIDQLMNLLFSQGCTSNEFMVDSCIKNLKNELFELLKVCCNFNDSHAQKVLHQFFGRIIPVYRELLKDAAFIAFSDPAAKSIDEVIITYPGFYAIAVYRFAHELSLMNVAYLPRLISEFCHSRTAIDIHPGAIIGCPVAIDHGTGVVIGETTVIGNHVRIYQGVTLGALVVKKSDSIKKRHPTIEDNVDLYSGCTILGGNTTIGHHSVIGGNVWITKSIPPNSVVYTTPEIKIRQVMTSEFFSENNSQ